MAPLLAGLLAGLLGGMVSCVSLVRAEAAAAQTAADAPALPPPTAANAPAPPAAPAAERAWEGALGLALAYSPTYQGSATTQLTARPAIFLRYGRWTVTSAGGFIDRRNEAVDRGLTGELLRRDDLQVKISARYDNGRDAGDDPALAGQHDVNPTLRARLSAIKKFGADWKVTAAVTPDLLGRGGGVLADLGLSREWRFAPYDHPVRVNTGAGLTWGSGQYMQSYFGVSPGEAEDSGNPVYTPGAGLRDIGFGVAMNTDLGPSWVLALGFGASRLLGPALDSPLTGRTRSWGVNGGLAWRF